MLIQKFRLAYAELAACVGVVLAGGVALRAHPGDPPPAAPSAVANVPKELPENCVAADGPLAKGKSPQEQIDESKKEIESLRKRVDALEKGPQPAPVLQKVVVTRPQARDVVVTRRYVGKILAHRHTDVCALMTGVVAEVSVKEGQAVKQGEVLFKVGPTLYKAKLDAETAELRIARLELDITKKLFEQKVISQREMSLHEAKLAKADARTKFAEAELAATIVRAPFDGHVGRLQEREGSTVKEGGVLTTLSDNSAMWVYFGVPEARYLEYMADREQMKAGAPIELVMANGRMFPQVGKLAAIEGQFEKGTGTIAFRAGFPNPEGLLRHGQSATVLVRESLKNAIVIPQRATFENGDRRYVYVVGTDRVAHQREVVVQTELEDYFVIKKGPGVTDRIVVNGVQQVRDGERVEYEYRKPQEGIGTSKKSLEE